MSSIAERLTDLSPQEKRALLTQLLRQKTSQATSLHPLSYGQQALWFLYQSAPESAAYNFALTTRIRSSVDIPALQRTFQSLIDRHSSLRTTFKTINANPVQEVHKYQEVCFEQTDASTWTWDELNKQVVKAYQCPFDLEQGPVFRVNLFTRSAQEHILLLTIHHIVFDGWSLWIFLDELRVLYPAEKSGTQVFLPSLNLTYADYVRKQTEMLTGPVGEKLWAYWQQQLSEELPVLNLPTDYPRPPVQTHQGDSHHFKLTEELTKGLKEMAQAKGITLYMLLLATFQVLLHRYTGQEDILVGSLTTGRNQTEFARVMGYFVNPIVLREDLSGNPTFEAFLSRVRQTVLAALEHQDYPFPLLVEKLQPNRDPSRSPLFQTLFALQLKDTIALLTPGKTGTQKEWGDFKLEFFEIEQQEGQFDLSLEMVEAKESILGVFKYNTDLFDVATIARMTGHLQTLLKGIIADPGQRLSDLPILTEAEQHQILVEWNDTDVTFPLDRCIHELFEAQVEQTPDAVALVFEDQQLIYREVNQKANQLAHYLRSLGVGPEVPVGICAERSFEMVIGLLGILKAGGAYVPMDPEYPKDRLAFMLEDSQVLMLLTQEKLITELPEQKAHVLCLDRDWETIARERSDNPVSDVTADNLMYVIYTSGSTGKPKGAMNIHRALCNRLLWMQDAYQLTEVDRVLQKTPFSFDVSGWEFFWPLIIGTCLVIAKPGGHKDSAYLVKLICEQNITTMHFVPSMLQVFLEEPEVEQCTGLRQVICSGEALSYDLQKRFFDLLGAELHNLYGPTEAAIDVTFWHCTRKSQRKTIPIGHPITNTQIYILDRYLQPVPIGVPGELHIGGVNLARGYLNRPELTQEKFITNPFSDDPQSRLYKTGDLARYLPDGNIEFLGRIDHQIKIRGFRVELEEIEAILAEHAAVREVVVIAREDQLGNKRLVAYVVSSDPAKAVTTNELRNFLKEKLPDYMIPSTFVTLEAFPLTPNGKVDRRALPAPEGLRPKLETNYVMPRSETERIIAVMWQETLQVDKVGIHDNFFELGGHSILAIQIYHKLQEHFEQELSLIDLFQYPTIHALAQYLQPKQHEQLPSSESGHDRAQRRLARGASMQQHRQIRQRRRTSKKQKGESHE